MPLPSPLPCAPLQVGEDVLSVLGPCADMANHAQQPNAAFWFSPRAAAFQLLALEVSPAGCRRRF